MIFKRRYKFMDGEGDEGGGEGGDGGAEDWR